MKVLIDTNVVLDVVQRRIDHVASSLALSRARNHPHTAVLCATTITTLHYLTRGQLGDRGARATIAAYLQQMDVAAVTRSVLDAALASPMVDFEDAVMAHAALQAGATAIITRNLRDFKTSPVRAYTPQEWLALSA